MEKSSYIAVVLCVLFLAGVAEGQNTCSEVICPRGRMCMAHEDDGVFTTCECPSSCPAGEIQPVCTYYNSQFSSRCQMHKYACAHDLTMKVKNEGNCDPNDNKHSCPESDLLQFPSRYLEWIMVAREKSIDPDFSLAQGARADSLTEQERKQVLLWEFDFIDKNKNELLDREEVEKIFDDIVRFEPCVYGFLLSCDLNGQQGIERREWDACFPITGTALESRL